MQTSLSNHDILQVNWDQVALDAGYKDSKNAKVMWSRLEKKLIDAAARVAAENDDDAGENLPVAPEKAGKKRKAAGSPRTEGPVSKGRPLLATSLESLS